jgi:putative transposase
MVKKSHSPEQVINKLREAEILLSQGATVGEACRKIGVTEQTYYRWRKEYGGLFICLLSNTTSFPKARGKGID